jgi:hypothetical protein
MLKTFFLLPAFSLLFLSCTKKTPLQELIHDADVVKVFVYSGNATAMHYETNDVGKIQQWKNYIKEDTALQTEACLPVGKIIFKTADDSTIMNFSLADECRFVQYELNGVTYHQSFTQQGVAYIDSLMKVQ